MYFSREMFLKVLCYQEDPITILVVSCHFFSKKFLESFANFSRVFHLSNQNARYLWIQSLKLTHARCQKLAGNCDKCEYNQSIYARISYQTKRFIARIFDKSSVVRNRAYSPFVSLSLCLCLYILIKQIHSICYRQIQVSPSKHT